MERLVSDLRAHASAQGWQVQEYAGEATYLTLASREKVVMTWWWVPEAHMTGLVTMLSLSSASTDADLIWRLWDAAPRPDWFRQHTLAMSLEGFENPGGSATRVVIRLSVFSEETSRGSLEHFEVATRWSVKVTDYIQRLANGEDVEMLIDEAEAASRAFSASSGSILEVEQSTLLDVDTNDGEGVER